MRILVGDEDAEDPDQYEYGNQSVDYHDSILRFWFAEVGWLRRHIGECWSDAEPRGFWTLVLRRRNGRIRNVRFRRQLRFQCLNCGVQVGDSLKEPGRELVVSRRFVYPTCLGLLGVAVVGFRHRANLAFLHVLCPEKLNSSCCANQRSSAAIISGGAADNMLMNSGVVSGPKVLPFILARKRYHAGMIFSPMTLDACILSSEFFDRTDAKFTQSIHFKRWKCFGVACRRFFGRFHRSHSVRPLGTVASPAHSLLSAGRP